MNAQDLEVRLKSAEEAGLSVEMLETGKVNIIREPKSTGYECVSINFRQGAQSPPTVSYFALTHGQFLDTFLNSPEQVKRVADIDLIKKLRELAESLVQTTAHTTRINEPSLRVIYKETECRPDELLRVIDFFIEVSKKKRLGANKYELLVRPSEQTYAC